MTPSNELSPATLEVATKHPQFMELVGSWRMMRDTVGGERLIKRRKGVSIRVRGNDSAPQNLRYRDFEGSAYLPPLHQQTPEGFASYRDRAVFLDATSRTLEFYLSLIFRKQVRVVDSEDQPVEIGPVGADSLGLHEFCQQACRDWFTTGRIGVMADTTDDGTRRTVAQREAEGLGPYLTFYRAEQIINWRHQTYRGQKRLVLVVLEEIEDNPEASEYDHSMRTIYRVLRLRDGVATVEEIDEEGRTVAAERPIMANGAPLTEIPFRILDASDADLQPPLEGIATINLAHYRNSASHENGIHHAGIPTPTLAGWDGEQDGLYLGTDRALVSSNPSFQAKYMEFMGHGLNQVKQALDDKRRDMANLGARLLMDQARFNEAAETVAMRKAGEQSLIGMLAQKMDEVMTWALGIFDRFNGLERGLRVRLNRDLLPASLSHQMVVALMNLQISGNLSKKMLFERLKDGEIVDSEADFERMKSDIEKDQAEEEERMLRIGESQDLVGRHADRAVSVQQPGDPGNEHGQGMTPARGD